MIEGWFPRPLIGRLPTLLVLDCGHTRWIHASYSDIQEGFGRWPTMIAGCETCHCHRSVTDVRDGAWMT